MKITNASIIVSVLILSSTPYTYAVSPDSPGAVSHQVKVTAVVPLSDLWADAIAKNSKISFITDPEVGEPVHGKATIIGLNNTHMKEDKVYVRIVSNKKDIKVLEGVTDENGNIEFSFVPTTSQEHTVTVIYEKFGRKVEINNRATIIPLADMSTLPLT